MPILGYVSHSPLKTLRKQSNELATKAIPKLAYQLRVAQVIVSQMLGESVGTSKTAVVTNLRQTSGVGL
jgi:hypothetical protein